jgi:2-octaprenyl-6-methoxyphenol hydroxylase
VTQIDSPVISDIAIVGGGMVGASLALALSRAGLSVVLVEATAPDSEAQPSFDERTTALGNGSRRVFEALGVWEALQAEAAPIRSIHISDAQRFGFARVDAAELGLQALGFVVANRAIGRELWSALRQAQRVTLRMPARVLAVELGAAYASLRLQDAAGESLLHARLVVAADGAQSLVRAAAGIRAQVHDYEQTAIVAAVRTDQPDAGIAYERFTQAGPMALLPLRGVGTGHWHTLVWAAAPADAQALLALTPPQFLARWQQMFGWRAGRALQLGHRGAYPLSLVRAATAVGPRSVLLGNAAQALHPVAGQGFNLGLRDAADLAELLTEVTRAGGDVGEAAVLQRYAAQRAADRDGVVRFTDALVRVFADRRPGVGVLRDLGLLAFDLLPPAKRMLGRVSLGFGGRRSALTRGVPL